MFNYTALDKKYSFMELHSYVKNQYGPRASRRESALVKFFIFFMGVCCLLFLWGAIRSIFELASGAGDKLEIAVSLFWQLMFIILPPAIYAMYLKYSVLREAQLEQFCKDNGLRFHPSLILGEQSGIIFANRYPKSAKNGIIGQEFGGFILFDYEYRVRTGRNSKTYSFGVARLRLNKKLPHILIDNKKDGSVSPFDFDRSQRLELEGDFNKYFNVFGPKEYEIEVLQILNPSVMQALINITEPVDIEIIGHDLYIYNKGNHRKKETLQSLFAAIEQLYSATTNVQKSFSMPEQIGTYKPRLKRSKLAFIIPLIGVGIYIILQLIAVVLRLVIEANL